MTLIDFYRADLVGANVKEAQAIRSYWFRDCQRHFDIREITSATVPPPSVRRVKFDVMDKDKDAPTYPVTTVAFDSFFARWSDTELRELYRLTKPRAYTPNPVPVSHSTGP